MGYEEEAAPFPARPNFGPPANTNAIGPGLCLNATVPPGGSCAIDLEFHPQSPGIYRAAIGLKDNAPDSPQTITLEGTAVAQTVIPPPLPPPPPLASTPKFGRKPAARTKSRTATFVFSAESSPAGFKCRWTKRGGFHACNSPFHLTELHPGPHVFSVYAVGANGTPGPVRTYHWRILR